VRRRQFLHWAALGMVAGFAPAGFAAVPAGKPAPDFSLALFDGKTLSLKELRGKPVLLDFWSST
jgi:cytochrome oxidase Cu insertion factor (SCO1/SenC/PrrC family)